MRPCVVCVVKSGAMSFMRKDMMNSPFIAITLMHMSDLGMLVVHPISTMRRHFLLGPEFTPRQHEFLPIGEVDAASLGKHLFFIRDCRIHRISRFCSLIFE